MVVVFEAGHGKDTPGKCSPDKSLMEWEYNRKICAELVEELKARGITYVYTYGSEDKDLSLAERVRLVNKVCSEHGSKNVLFISIHGNAAGSGDWMSAKGWSGFVVEGARTAEKCCTEMYKAFEEEFTDRSFRYYGGKSNPVWKYPFYVCKHTYCPAMLLENFFYDNREECEFMKRADTPKRVAKAIANGIELCKKYYEK